MKKKLLAWVLAMAMMASCVPTAMAADTKQVGNDVLVSYDFSEAKDGKIPDLSGNNRDGLLKGAATVSPGIIDNSLTLNGTSGTYLEIPQGTFNNEDVFTMSFFIKQDMGYSNYFALGVGRDIDHYFFFNPSRPNDTAGNKRARFAITTGRYLTEQAVEMLPGETRNQWVHYAVSMNGSTMTMYKDGVQVAQNKGVTLKLSDLGTDLKAYLGKSFYDGSGGLPADPYFKGAFDNFIVYNRALTEDEVMKDYLAGVPESEILTKAVAGLDIKASNNLDRNLVLGDLVLPVSSMAGRASIAWASSDDAIAPNGTVIRSSESKPVTLTATIKVGEATQTKAFDLIVLGEEDSPFSINVDATEKVFDTSEDLYGLFFEDINFAADGGLNPELLQNRSFENNNNWGRLHFWNASARTGAGTVTSQTASPMNSTNPSYAKLNITKPGFAYLNDGYKGVPVKSGAKYNFRMFIKNANYVGDITVGVEDGKGELMTTPATFTVSEGSEWVEIETLELTGLTQGNGKFVMTMNGTGSFDADFISLIPQDTWVGDDASKWPLGGLRKDLVEALDGIGPSFVRFPGGCVVEGKGLDNMYEWKDTIGPLEERKEQKNRWSDHFGNSSVDYWQSYGLGYHEYFQLCEDISAEPLPVVNCAMTCQFTNNGQFYKPGTPEFEREVQNTLDLVEYANGDISTEWGAKRAENGHPEPFNLKYLGIGNENWGTQFLENFKVYKEAVLAVYPDLIIISSSGPSASGSDFNLAWNEINKNHTDTYVDEHYYMAPEWFINNTDRYNYYDRSGAKVFAGEYAAHDGAGKGIGSGTSSTGGGGARPNSIYTAVAEAAFLTGLERNSDVVKLASYAPLFGKINDWQWTPDMIWFDNFETVLTPNYYVQQMFARNYGDELLAVESKKFGQDDWKLSGGIALASWNTAVEYDNVKVISNETKEVLFEDDFEDGMDPLWTIKRGDWKVENGVLKQTNSSNYNTDYMIYIDDVDWVDYTLEVEAKKTGGAEGFLVGVGVNGPEEYTWYNAGGWDNSRDAVEMKKNNVKREIGMPKHDAYSKIVTGQTYDFKIEYGTDYFKLFKDDKVIQDTMIKQPQEFVFSSATRDSASGKINLKLVNTDPVDKQIKVNLTGANLTGKAVVKTLAHTEKDAQNTLTNKTNIAPVAYEMDVTDSFIFTVPAYSSNVIVFNDELEVVEPDPIFEAVLENKEISGDAGTTFTLPVSLTNFPVDNSYKSIEGVIQLPEELSVTDVTPSDFINFDNDKVQFQYNVDTDNNLRFAFIGVSDKDLAFTVPTTLAQQVTAPTNPLVNIEFTLKSAQEKDKTMSVSMNRLLARGTEDILFPFGLDNASSTITVAGSSTVISAAARELFVGDDSDVIPANKKAVAVEFIGIDSTYSVHFKDSDAVYYYSEQISTEKSNPTYVALVAADTALADLSNVENYTLTANGSPETLIFGNGDTDPSINAQDALKILTVWLRKDVADDKLMLALNVNADPRIDTQDAITVVDFYVNSSIKLPIVLK